MPHIPIIQRSNIYIILLYVYIVFNTTQCTYLYIQYIHIYYNEYDMFACNTVSYVLCVRSISSTYNSYTESNIYIYIYIYCNRIFHEQTADISGRKPCGSNPI